MSKFYSIPVLADSYRQQLAANNPEWAERISGWDDNRVVSHMLEGNPRLAQHIDFNSLWQGLKTFKERMKAVPGSSVQTLAMQAMAGEEMFPPEIAGELPIPSQFKALQLEEEVKGDEPPIQTIQDSFVKAFMPDTWADRTKEWNIKKKEVQEEGAVDYLRRKSDEAIIDASKSPVFKWGDSLRKAGKDSAAEAFKTDPYLMAQSKWFADELATATFGDFFKKKMIGALVGQGLPTLASGLALNVAGNRLLPGLGSAASFAFMFGVEGGTQYNELYEDAISKGHSHEDATALATSSAMQTGLVNAILENLRIGQMTKAFGLNKIAKKELAKKLTEKSAKVHKTLPGFLNKVKAAKNSKALQNTLFSKPMINAYQEGVEEWAQGINQRASQAGYSGYKLDDILGTSDATALSEFFGGFYGGMTMGGALGAYEYGAMYPVKKSLKKAQEDAQSLAQKEQDVLDGVLEDTNDDLGASVGTAVQNEVLGGSEKMSWKEYLEPMVESNGKTFPQMLQKPSEDASDASKQAWIDKNKNRDQAKRLIAAMKKSGMGRDLLNEFSAKNKALAEADIREFFRRRIPILRKKQYLGKGVSYEKDNALIDELIDDFIRGGSKLALLEKEETKKGFSLAGTRVGAQKYKLEIEDDDLRNRIVHSSLASIEIEESDIRKGVEDGSLNEIEADARQMAVQLERQSIEQQISGAGEIREQDVPVNIEDLIDEDKQRDVGLSDADIENIVTEGMIKAAENLEEARQRDVVNKPLKEMGTDEVALFRGNVYSSLKKHKFDVEAASKELSKKSAKDIKKILGAFKDTIDVEKDDRYPKKQDGTVAFGKKKQIARALAEDLLKDFGKFSKEKKPKGSSAESVKKDIEKVVGKPDTNVKDTSTETVDRVALHKERMRSKGQDIVNENNPLREITKEFGEQSGLAYVAAASASRNSFLNNLSKMGYSDEQIGSIKKEIGDIDAFQKRAKNVKTSTSVRVSRIYRDLSSRLISNIDAMISPKVNAYINRLGASEVEWKVVAPMFDESYKSFLETQDALGVTSPEDRETAFEIFVKGMRKGIGASTYSNKKDIRKMFTQWALNHPLGIGRPEIFHYRVVHKARRMLEKIFGVTNVMWDESIKRGSNMMKTFELEDREGLDVIEEDIKDDIVDGREMDEENLHILSSNIKRMVETATGKDIFSDDMINIQDASIDSANLGDFVDFLMKEYGISEKALLDKKISNLITRYHNTMKNRIPSSAKKFFVLSNLTPENELDTDFNFSYHLRLKKQDWKTRRTLPGYAPKNFLDERGLGERTAYLYASDVMQVFKLKKSHGELVNEETGEVYQDKLYAKENTSRITRKKLNQINDELGLRYVELGSERPMFIVGMKHGGSRALVIGDATDDDISIGTSEEAIETFLADEIANKRMTEEQAQNMRNYAEAWIDSNENVWIQIIGRHNYLKEAFHNKYLMKDIDGTPNKNHIQWMFNRMRLIFSEGSVAYGMGDSKIMIIDPSNTTITYKGKVLESWADYLKEGIFRYGFDGALFTSHKNFIKKQGLIGSDFIEKGGVFGWLKTVLSDRKDNGDSFLGVKALEMLAPDGMEWTDGDGNLIARSMLDENGMVQIVDKNGNYIDQLLSTEESKIGHAGVGYYNQLNTPLTIPETATRILQTPSEMSKNSSASPFQWLDMMLDPELLEPGNKNYNEEASNAYKILTKHTIDIANVYLKQLGHMSKYPATVGAYLKRLTNKKTLSETELNKWLNALDGPELAFMAHNFFVDQYEPMIKNRMIVNGAYKGRKLNHSSYLHIRPNFAEDLDEWESAPSMSDRVSWNKMEKKLLATLSSQEKKDYKAIKRDDYKVDFMNEWLATDPLEEWEYWTLDFRMPVNSIIAPQMFRNDKFKYRRTGDTAQYHLMSILKNFFADFDGDTVSKKWMNKEETEVLLKFTRKQNEDGSWSQSDVYESLMNYPKLDLFEPPEHKDLSDFGGMLDAMTDGYKNAWAMGLVMNVKALRGVMQTKSFQLHLKNTLKNHANQGRDYQIDVIKSSEMVLLPWKLKDTTDESHLNPGEEIVVDESGNKLLRTTSRNALDLIMQAAVDDVKYGLLAEWGFDGVPFMMNMIFKKTYKDTGEVAESLDDYGNRNYDSYYLWKLLTKQPSAQFAFSRSRAGLDKNRQNQSMRQIMFQSKDISRQKNLTDKELRGIMKAYGVRADLQKGYSPKMMDIIIHNKPTHYEMLLSRPFEYFKKTFGTDDDEAFMSFLRSDPNVQANAHRLTMEQLTGRPAQGEDAPKVEGKIDTWRLPKKDGGIFQEGITAEQEAEGYAFFRVLAKDFYRILDAGKVIRQKVIRDVSFSIAAYDHQEEFRDLENKYKPEFDKLSPQAQFVSTIWFLQGASGDYTKLPPGTVKAQADNAMEANRLLDLIKDYDVMLAAYRKEYRETRKKIESGEITDVVAKPTKAGRMDFEYDGDQAEGIKSANAFDAVKSGEKTATTRYKKTKFWEDLEIGDTVEFSNKSKEKVLVRVTESPREVDFANMSKEELKRWSELEGWSLEYAESNAKNKRKGIQFQFALIDTEPVPGDVNARGVRRIISGAQTGADQGALEAARDDLGIETGGHMTSDHMTKDGPRPDFEKTYGMQTTKSTKYPPRSKKNIDSADASIAFRLKPSLGTDKSIGYARTGIWQKVLSASKDDGHSPVLVLNNAENTRRNRKKIRDFIDRNEPRVLNIIGNSEQKSPGLQKAVRALLNDALREDPTRFRPMTNRLDRIKKEALRTQKRKDETEGKVQALKDTMEELNDIKGKKHVQQKRYIEKLLPSDLWSEEARHIYVDEFNKQLKVATDEKPQSAFLVSYQEFDRILNQHLVRNGTC